MASRKRQRPEQQPQSDNPKSQTLQKKAPGTNAPGSPIMLVWQNVILATDQHDLRHLASWGSPWLRDFRTRLSARGSRF